MKLVSKFSAATLALVFTASIALAQTAQPTPTAASYPDCSRNNINACPAQVFPINNIQSADIYRALVNPLQNNLRNATVSLNSSPNHSVIFVRATPDDLAVAQKIIADLDHPTKNYRLTYTVTELDGSKQIGTQHYAMIMTSGQETSLKLGNKFPMVTGSSSAGNGPAQTQFTYIDVGMNFDATLTEMGENAMLKSSVEDSSVAPQPPEIGGVKEPIIRQATLRGESLLTPGKPLMLGSVDIPGSTSHLDIEVVMQQLP
jgi:type II secretory pathway component GspD/PulD (secretin)